MTPEDAWALVAALAAEHRVAAWGATTLDRLRTDDFLLPTDTLSRLTHAVSLALPLLPAVLATLTDRPNRLYEHHYRQTNFALDRLGLALGRAIQDSGYAALPIPASQIVDWENQRGHLSHKRVAVAAGVGWLGRNNLLVTPAHGAQIRLITVLTDLPLPTSAPTRRDCGDCRACLEACPGHAIGETPMDFDHLACFARLKEFQRRRDVGQYICGLCVRACTGGRPTTNVER
ncbi:MAG TPA: epoxyqueuosine reductase [candidate division WOR-3 bacterium]|uniref:Epoxyqueuosine reductase n=1 Tax=candidate division WOR-3 bacterium TaxID=2052148 RepID=A0A7V0T668_UNCW3|nr:epoxyqueuosine reductase [candidate division WOR-3 bacterium]